MNEQLAELIRVARWIENGLDHILIMICILFILYLLFKSAKWLLYFKSHEEFLKYSDDFYKQIKPEIDELRIARMKSEQKAKEIIYD